MPATLRVKKILRQASHNVSNNLVKMEISQVILLVKASLNNLLYVFPREIYFPRRNSLYLYYYLTVIYIWSMSLLHTYC